MRTSLHVHGGLDDAARRQILDYYDRARPPIVKFMDHRDPILMAEMDRRGVKIVYRLYTDNQELGGQVAKDFIRTLVSRVEGTPITWAEGYNEAFNGPDDLEDYAEFEVARMRALEEVGKKAAIGCFSTGTPEPEHWHLFLPALEWARDHGHVLALHEYAGPYMQYFTETPDGANQWDQDSNSWTGASSDTKLYYGKDLTGWLTLRYRKAYAELRRLGVGDLPLIITEGGIDDCTPRPGPPGKGYKPFDSRPWNAIPGIGDYAAQRYWYMWHVSHDNGIGGRPRVLGVTDFGWRGTATGWPDFDLATDPPMVERVIEAEAPLPIGWYGIDAPVPKPTPPTPTPPPTEVKMEGIDVSRWQGQMDWPKARGAGAEFAWIKATEGSAWVDVQYSRNAHGAAASGVLFGPYHFFNNGIDPIAQARHFHATVLAAQTAPGLVPALDFEDTAGRTDPKAMEAFAAEVERLFGCRPIVYTARWWWTAARLGGSQAWAARLPLWVADYKGPVDLPATGEWVKATIHQWTSSGPGATFGAQSSAIDQNRFWGTRDGLLAVVGYKQPAAGPDLVRLWAEARDHQLIRLNPDSALQAAIAVDSMVPISNEWDFSPDEIAQYAGRLDGKRYAVYIWDRRTGRVTRYDPVV